VVVIGVGYQEEHRRFGPAGADAAEHLLMPDRVGGTEEEIKGNREMIQYHLFIRRFLFFVRRFIGWGLAG
jgi:hypothetical protein